MAITHGSFAFLAKKYRFILFLEYWLVDNIDKMEHYHNEIIGVYND
jgi:hypothetical protein